MPIVEHVLKAKAFLEATRGRVVLDVRSPKEYAEGHIPGAVSFPLFTDDERAAVGTTYKQIGKSEAINAGLSFVGPKLQSLAAQARDLFEGQASPQPLLIYCWRGGMSSGSLDWLLRTSQIPTMCCEGGYKACRAVYNEVLEAPRPYVVVGGMTGSGKTEIIHSLKRMGEGVADLEGLARHFGSSALPDTFSGNDLSRAGSHRYAAAQQTARSASRSGSRRSLKVFARCWRSVGARCGCGSP